jgi:hypothetical protein
MNIIFFFLIYIMAKRYYDVRFDLAPKIIRKDSEKVVIKPVHYG